MERRQGTSKFSFFQLFGWMIVFELILISFAIHFYNGNFLLWQYPLSTSGVAYTYIEGNPNTASMYLFALAMFVGAVSLALASLGYFRQPEIKNGKIKSLLSMIGSLGFLITTFSPDDIRHRTHIWGMALAVASLWLITFVYVAEQRQKIKTRAFIAAELLLNLPLFAYAQAYFIKFDPASYNFQKISLATICIVLLWSVRQSEKSLPSS